jgi:hypothetical protein
LIKDQLFEIATVNQPEKEESLYSPLTENCSSKCSSKLIYDVQRRKYKIYTFEVKEPSHFRSVGCRIWGMWGGGGQSGHSDMSVSFKSNKAVVSGVWDTFSSGQKSALHSLDSNRLFW